MTSFYSTLLHSPPVHHTLLYAPLLYSTPHYSAVLYFTLHYCTLLYYILLLLHSILLFFTLLHSTQPVDWRLLRYSTFYSYTTYHFIPLINEYLHHIPLKACIFLSSRLYLTDILTKNGISPWPYSVYISGRLAQHLLLPHCDAVDLFFGRRFFADPPICNRGGKTLTGTLTGNTYVTWIHTDVMWFFQHSSTIPQPNHHY